jgi:hypothetical protein
MPYKVKKTKAGDYEVSSPHGKKAKHTSKEKAKAQQRLLYAIENDPDFIQRRKKKNGMD